MPSKSLFASKTFWVATTQAVIGALITFSGAYPHLGWLMMGKSLLDVVLRTMTEQPINLVN